jgi:multiple sugar transport system permease protein
VRTGKRQQDIGYGSTIAMVFFAIVLLVSVLQRVLVARGGNE